jgi:hypothetical protein
VFTGKLASLKVEGVAVAVVGRITENADVVVFIEPAMLHVVGNVTPN